MISKFYPDTTGSERLALDTVDEKLAFARAVACIQQMRTVLDAFPADGASRGAMQHWLEVADAVNPAGPQGTLFSTLAGTLGDAWQAHLDAINSAVDEGGTELAS